uniref:Uncharacterized protein n=1 Tax=Chenopodium quinoa TaxID=63459 RepID=A0A803KUR1_CHEQI
MDKKAVDYVLKDSKRKYAEKAKAQAPTIIIDDVSLPPYPSTSQEHGPSCILLVDVLCTSNWQHIAGGTSVTPMLQVIEAILKNPDDKAQDKLNLK